MSDQDRLGWFCIGMQGGADMFYVKTMSTLPAAVQAGGMPWINVRGMISCKMVPGKVGGVQRVLQAVSDFMPMKPDIMLRVDQICFIAEATQEVVDVLEKNAAAREEPPKKGPSLIV